MSRPRAPARCPGAGIDVLLFVLFLFFSHTRERKINMSCYVKRTRGDAVGWVGPIRSERQAYREADAWRQAGWHAVVRVSAPDVRAAVRAWQRAADASK
jgi:hypothetical protein